ncbi:hypothetical protein [Mycobacterium marinum]|uniref:hypothetical protein n=1 Tax=Mycobacterium marinum TaxID=1781 RepID=UPI002359B047|nr:hypothetical protein [Mycobacterium marinum]MDC9015201.1 hypothetical protein [Mycobacterium marinum]
MPSTMIPDRLSLRTIRRDYWRSLNHYRTGHRDTYAIAVIFGAPVIAGGLSVYPLHLVISQPVALLPAVSLLSGVLLAAAGQIITLRARIADSLTLSTDKRVTAHIRETLSGLLLSAVAALFDALLLGVLAVVMRDIHRWWHIALSALVVAVTVYLAMMFIVTARRLYSTYLEVFEGGSPLPKRQRKGS